MGAVALATRRTKFIFKLSAIETFGKVILISAGLYFYSLMGVLYAGVAIALIMFVVTMISARSLLGATLASQIGNLWQVATACVAMTVSVLVVRHGLQGRDLGVVVELGIIAFSGAAIYGGILLLLGVRPRDFLSGFGAKD
jgi:PST family polysaccharide transporter